MSRAAAAERVGFSTITFRFRPLEEALTLIEKLGATQIDLGAIPDVTDHVPVPFNDDPADYEDLISGHGLQCGAVNADFGDLNDPALTPEVLTERATPLLGLAASLGAALIIPCGRANWEPIVDDQADLDRIADNIRLVSRLAREHGVRLLVEVLHHKRWIHTVERAEQLLAKVDHDTMGLLFDVAHIVASSDDPVAWAAQRIDRIDRVHLRDAVPGNLNIGIGRGNVDFEGVIRTLEGAGYRGPYILELETHDVEEADREADAARSRAEIIALVEQHEKEK